MSLHALVGHHEVREALSSALLIHGPRGVGKQRLALWLAQLSVCDASGSEPCGACGPCRMALSLEHPDVHWYFPLPRPKNASGDKLVDALEDARMQALSDRRAEPLRASYADEVRGLYLGTVRNIRRRAHQRPTMADGQTFIVGESELLVPQEASPEAANALLKLLEEPPGAARFILTSSEPGMLLPTIRSRTVPLHAGALPEADVAAFLQERSGCDEKVAAWAARLGQGAIGRSLGFLPDEGDPGPLESLRRRAYELVVAATSPKTSAAYELALGFPPAGARKLLDLFAFVEEWLRDLAAAAAGADDQLFNQDAAQRLEKHVRESGIDAVDVPAAFTVVESARELARGNVNPQLVVTRLIRELRGALLRREVVQEVV